MIFGRLITAMCTPFSVDGKIDWRSLESIIQHLMDTGSDAIVVGGTTAESPTLSKEEKISLFAFTVKQVSGRVKVIAGTGSNHTAESIQLTQRAEETGVDGVMLVAPYYNKPSQEGLYQHFKAIASATKLPVMVYNVPGRTGVNMTAETMARLAELENMIAFKEASGNISQITRLISSVSSDVAVYSGDDAYLLPVLAVGGIGVVGVASHLIGKEMKKIIETYLAGEVSHAAGLHQNCLSVFEGLFPSTNPSPVPLKYALSQKGLCEPTVRLPLVEMNNEEKKAADRWLQNILS